MARWSSIHETSTETTNGDTASETGVCLLRVECCAWALKVSLEGSGRGGVKLHNMRAVIRA